MQKKRRPGRCRAFCNEILGPQLSLRKALVWKVWDMDDEYHDDEDPGYRIREIFEAEHMQPYCRETNRILCFCDTNDFHFGQSLSCLQPELSNGPSKAELLAELSQKMAPNENKISADARKLGDFPETAICWCFWLELLMLKVHLLYSCHLFPWCKYPTTTTNDCTTQSGSAFLKDASHQGRWVDSGRYWAR